MTTQLEEYKKELYQLNQELIKFLEWSNPNCSSLSDYRRLDKFREYCKAVGNPITGIRGRISTLEKRITLLTALQEMDMLVCKTNDLLPPEIAIHITNAKQSLEKLLTEM